MNGEYDVLIIGGGLNGAASAAALTRLGYRMLLLEQADFASGGTSSPIRIVHGGLHDLASGNARFVHDALRAREALLREHPHLVQPLPMMVPVYAGDPHPRVLQRAQFVLYDLLSPRKVTPWHRTYSAAALRRVEPALESHGLRGAYRYHDALAVMPERLCLEYLSEARTGGADLRNYSAVDFLIVSGGTAQGVDYHDVRTGQRHTARARMIVNAAGPWADAVAEASGRALRPRISIQKTSALVLQLEGRGPRHAIRARTRTSNDVITILPWLDHHIVAGTPIPYDGPPEAARCESWEVDMLVSEAARLLPGIGVDHDHVLYCTCGLWASPRDAGGALTGPIRSRRYVTDHTTDGVEQLITITGGEIADARAIASTVARTVQRSLGRAPGRARPQVLPARAEERVSFLPPDTWEHLRNRYGHRASEVAAAAVGAPELMEPISPYHPEIGAEVAYAVGRDAARTVADVLLRRLPVGRTHDLGRAAAPVVARILQPRLGWSDAERDQAVRDYEMDLHRTLSVFRAPAARDVSAADKHVNQTG